MRHIEIEVTHPERVLFPDDGRFTIRDVPKRLSGQRDPWADMYRHCRSLNGPIKRVAKLRARTA